MNSYRGGDVIKNNVVKRILAIIMLVFIMLPQLTINKISYAADDIDNVLDGWLTGSDGVTGVSPKFYHFTYKEENNSYNAYFMKIALPKQTDSYPRVAYKYGSSGAISFVLQETASKEFPIKLDLYVAQTGRSVLKRQAANNFNVGDSNFGYLLEVAGNITSYEGKELRLKVITETESKEYEKDVQILADDWAASANFKNIDQNSADESIWSIIWKFLTNLLGEVKNLLESIFNKVCLSVADGILSLVSTAVGEPVTIDRVIFGKVGKLSINFWNGTQLTGDGSGNVETNIENSNSVMSVMAPVVNRWYSVLFAVAVLVYLAALLVVGIKIVFASTGDAKAKYKDVFQAWVTGVMILCLFPYVMKYTVRLNNVLVEMINSDLGTNNANAESIPLIDSTTLENASDSFGEGDFIASVTGSSFDTTDDNAKKDMMLYIRELAGNLGKMSLTFVYFVMLGELIVIIFVYYKRVFMMAFLITIFPVIAIMFIVEKLISGSSGSFKNWLSEYTVLVFTQSFHAAVYVIIVNAGINAYIEDENWLFMLMCIIFLFQGEKILRSIFGMKSSANTISDLAKAGMAGYGIAKTAAGILKRDKKEDGDDKDLKEAEEKSTPKQPQTTSASNNGGTSSGANNSSNGSGGAGGNTQQNGNSASQPTLPEDVTNDPNANFEAAQNLVRAQALKQKQKTKKGRGVAGKISSVMKVTGGVAGATLGLAAGLAQGNVEKAVSNAAVGAAAGQKVGGALATPIRGISNAYRGRKLKQKIRKGDLDQEFKQLGFDLASLDTEKQQMFREALAQLGSRTTRMGKTSGELKLLNTVSKINNKNNGN